MPTVIRIAMRIMPQTAPNTPPTTTPDPVNLSAADNIFSLI